MMKKAGLRNLTLVSKSKSLQLWVSVYISIKMGTVTPDLLHTLAEGWNEIVESKMFVNLEVLPRSTE